MPAGVLASGSPANGPIAQRSGAAVYVPFMSDEIGLEELSQLALKLTFRMLEELERRMDEPAKEGGAFGLSGKSPAQYKSLGTDLTKNVRALTGMLREARAQKKDAYALFKKMSAAERNEVVLTHCRNNLSTDQQKDLIQMLLAEINEGK